MSAISDKTYDWARKQKDQGRKKIAPKAEASEKAGGSLKQKASGKLKQKSEGSLKAGGRVSGGTSLNAGKVAGGSTKVAGSVATKTAGGKMGVAGKK